MGNYLRVGVENYGFGFSNEDEAMFLKSKWHNRILYKKRKFLTHCKKCKEIIIINAIDIGSADYYSVEDVYCDKCNNHIFDNNQFIQPDIDNFNIFDSQQVKLIEDKYNVKLSKS